MSTLLEFKAGRMLFDEENKKLLKPEIAKGLIQISSEDDGLLHFKWANRDSNSIEEDFILFPDDAVFHKVKQTSDRVYSLKFQSTGRRTFYWMQDKSNDNDAQRESQVNQLMSDGGQSLFEDQPQPKEEEEEAAPMQEDSKKEEEEKEKEQANSSSATSASASSATATGGNPNSAAAMQSILSNLFSGGQLQARDPDVDLTDVLSSAAVGPLLSDDSEELKSALTELLPHLPEDAQDEKAIVDLLRSPQFQQSLTQLDHALSSGGEQLSGILIQLGLDPNFASQFPPVEAFIRAMIAKFKPSS